MLFGCSSSEGPGHMGTWHHVRVHGIMDFMKYQGIIDQNQYNIYILIKSWILSIIFKALHL